MVDREKPYSTSSLTNGVNIIMELFRRYCSEIEQAEFQHHEYQVQIQVNRNSPQSPTAEKLKALSIDLNDLFKVIGDSLSTFSTYLCDPKAVVI
jgi:hypothetical protein